jgi:hypothetical protein
MMFNLKNKCKISTPPERRHSKSKSSLKEVQMAGAQTYQPIRKV